jgi:uncharacterized protein
MLGLPLRADADNLPSPSGFVNDFAGILSSQTRQDLEQQLTEYERTSSNEIAVATVKSLDGDSIEDLANTTFQQWGVGKKGSDNGVLILVAVDDRKVRIEVGYGLEGALTDTESGIIIRSSITPKFKQGDYDGGIRAGVQDVIDQLGGAPPPQEAGASSVSEHSTMRWGFGEIVTSVVWLLIIVVYLGSFMARTRSIYAGGILGLLVGAVIGLVLTLPLYFVAIPALGLGLFGLVLDFILSRTYARSSHPARHRFWSSWGGFYGGPSSFGGSGFGGFGGFGGGSSGGGGASGGW